MIAAHGFTAEQRQPYTFNPAPFLADTEVGMQGYLSSEPYLVEKEGGFAPNVFLIADAGYSTYATTVETMADTIASSPEVVKCFVEGSRLDAIMTMVSMAEAGAFHSAVFTPDMLKNATEEFEAKIEQSSM